MNLLKKLVLVCCFSILSLSAKNITLNFQYKLATLEDSSFVKLDDIASSIEDNKDINPVIIHAYADENGSDRYNIALSKRRAKAMKNELIIRGINPSRIAFFYFGELYPLCEGNNKRANIKLIVGDITPEDIKQHDMKNLYFAYKSDSLDEVSKQTLTGILGELEDSDEILLYSHTDNKGPRSYNKELSQKRAEFVKEKIQEQKPNMKVKIKAFGEDYPVLNNTSEKFRALNRRVEVKVLKHAN